MTWPYLAATMLFLTGAIGVNFTPRISPIRVWCFRALVCLALVRLAAAVFIPAPYGFILALVCLAILDACIVAAVIWAERLATANLRARHRRLQS